MSTHIEIVIAGNLKASGPLTIDEDTDILDALREIIDVERATFRLNGETANGEEKLKEGDRVTAVPEAFKVKAGA